MNNNFFQLVQQFQQAQNPKQAFMGMIQLKKYDYKNPIDIIYTLIWLEELLPNIKVDLLEMKQFKEKDLILIQNGIHEWNLMKSKRQKREISYKEYIEWKLTYEYGEW